MNSILGNPRERLLHFLKRVAPFSVVEKGSVIAAQGGVIECSKSGGIISGVIREEQAVFTPTLSIVSAREMEATCSCCSVQEMREQWCHHAVALLLRSGELGFTETHHGFETPRRSTKSVGAPEVELAAIIKEYSRLESAATSAHAPRVSAVLFTSDARLGVRILFNGELQGPAVFEDFRPVSVRELDNLLLRTTEDAGLWEEHDRCWWIKNDEEIARILGLLQEYNDITIDEQSSPCQIHRDPLDVHITLRWTHSGAIFNLHWHSNGRPIRVENFYPIGAGHKFLRIDNDIFTLSKLAQRIVPLFLNESSLELPLQRVAPLLAALQSSGTDLPFLSVENPDARPETRVVSPEPILRFERIEDPNEHFSSARTIRIGAVLEFRYPPAPRGEHVVHLPDLAREDECNAQLKSLGFQPQHDHPGFIAQGDTALDLIYRGPRALPTGWVVEGFEQLKKGLRFSDLSIAISLSGAERGKDSEQFSCKVVLRQNNSVVPLHTLFKNARNDSDRWIRLDSGAFARVPAGGLMQLKATLGMLDSNFRMHDHIQTDLSMAQALSLSRLDADEFAVSLDARLKSLAKKLKDFTAIEPITPTKHFSGKLRNYQEEGLSWLHFLNTFGLGGILADEMGLGKTVQTLALFQYLRDNKKKSQASKPALVVAPTSVITNWLYEAKRFTPELKVLLLHGPQRKQHFSSIPAHDIIITSYALLRMDRYDLERFEFSYVVLDEAQNIKNPQAATTIAAKALRARNRLALTGTPTENRPLELWSIFDFLMPGYLGSEEFFRSYIERPIVDAGPSTYVTRLLNTKTRPFILRRTKAEVERDLPPKIESVLHVEMTDSQRELYNHVVEEVRPQVFDAIKKKGVRGASVSILAALLRLRQICNHPNSIEALRESPGFDSGKFTLLKELVLEALESGRKILLFCQFLEMLSLIKEWLNESDVRYSSLDGSTKNRQEVVDRFNSDPDVRLFLISLKAGGTGLNLASADMVVIYDPWWNPAVEHQAVDRAHRIGQKKTVHVYRLVTENSIEQKIMDLKARKAKIVDALVHGNSLSTLNLTKDDLEDLFQPVAVG